MSLSFQLKPPRPDLFQQTQKLYNENLDPIDLKPIQKIEALALGILALTLTLYAAQKRYCPLPKLVEERLLLSALIPLPFIPLLEGLRQQGTLVNELSALRQSTS